MGLNLESVPKEQLVGLTILDQLGGNKFLTMTGATNLTTTSNSIGFRLPRISKWKHCKIELNELDYYNVEFTNFKGFEITKSRKVINVDFENLQKVFTNNTGLNTTL